MRARIVLAVADGEGPAAISARLGVSRPTVTQWRDRFLASGLEGLNDAPRSGRPKTVDDAAILAATLEPPPAKLGVTHWSTRLLAGELSVGDATVARAWRRPPAGRGPRRPGPPASWPGRAACPGRPGPPRWSASRRGCPRRRRRSDRAAAKPPERRRSEERRVGKECRSRWSPYH